MFLSSLNLVYIQLKMKKSLIKDISLEKIQVSQIISQNISHINGLLEKSIKKSLHLLNWLLFDSVTHYRDKCFVKLLMEFCQFVKAPISFVCNFFLSSFPFFHFYSFLFFWFHSFNLFQLLHNFFLFFVQCSNF